MKFQFYFFPDKYYLTAVLGLIRSRVFFLGQFFCVLTIWGKVPVAGETEWVGCNREPRSHDQRQVETYRNSR